MSFIKQVRKIMREILKVLASAGTPRSLCVLVVFLADMIFAFGLAKIFAPEARDERFFIVSMILVCAVTFIAAPGFFVLWARFKKDFEPK